MGNVNNLCFLQVKGKNQFEKEILETKDIINKVIDQTALHRNENTHEIEGMDDENQGALLFKSQSHKSLESMDGVTPSVSQQQSETNRKKAVKHKSSINDISSIDDSSTLKHHQKTKDEKTGKQIDYQRYKVDQVISQHIDK